mgnify:CR=1 FL=1
MRNPIPYVAAVAALGLAGCGGLETLGNADTLANLAQAGGTAAKAAFLSDSEIKTLSDQSCAESDSKSQVADANSPYTVRLNKVMQPMPASINGQPVNYKVYLSKDVNAWAMANGCIRVYSGLMDAMTDDELRGVLGHEAGHVALGHSKKAMQVAYSATAARQVAGAAGGIASTLSKSQLGDMTEKLVNAQFSQSQESAADDYAFDLLTQRKLPREGLVTGFEKLAKSDSGQPSLFSSHPPSAERAARMRQRLAGAK